MYKNGYTQMLIYKIHRNFYEMRVFIRMIYEQLIKIYCLLAS